MVRVMNRSGGGGVGCVVVGWGVNSTPLEKAVMTLQGRGNRHDKQIITLTVRVDANQSSLFLPHSLHNKQGKLTMIARIQ